MRRVDALGPYDQGMWRRVRAVAVAVMVLCVVGGIGTIIWHSLGGDYDKYGRVDVPGSGTVTLPRGQVNICYAVRLATNGGGGALTVPDLSFSMDSPEGVRDPVVTEDVGGTVTVNSAAHVRVWKLQVKDPGAYHVTTDGDVAGYIAPQLTFGSGSRVPLWPLAVFALVLVIMLGLAVIATHAAGAGGSTPRPAPATTPSILAGPAPAAAPAVTTPEQELARLAQLQQLADLHASGTLSEAEYDAARSRLGG